MARSPHTGQIVQQKCATCHMPMAWTEVKQASRLPEAVLFGTGILDQANPVHAVVMDGVSCALCHQIADQGLESDKAHSDDYPLDTAAVPPSRPLYGPYREAVVAPMQGAVGFTPTYGPQVNDHLFPVTHFAQQLAEGAARFFDGNLDHDKASLRERYIFFVHMRRVVVVNGRGDVG